MRLILTTCFGIEDVVAKELTERISAAKIVELRKGRVIVDVKRIEPVLGLRSIHHVIKLLSVFEFSDIKALAQKIMRIDFSEELKSSKTFRITSERAGNHEFTSLDLQRIAGEIIVKRYGKKVSLKNFDTEIRVDVIDNLCYVGVQLTRESLHKRGYRVFEHPAALKPTLAYAMLRIAGVKKSESLLDPMCGGGTIAIEAALSVKPRKIFASDKNEKYVEGAKLNAEKAGVARDIEFAVRACRDMRWVGEVDKIVTNPPFGVRMGRGRRFLRKLYFDLLNAGYEVVRDKICLLSLKSSLFKYAVKTHGKFRIVHERTVGHGDIYPKLFVLEKKK